MLVGDHLGSLAGKDLKVRCSAGLDHDRDGWSARKRVLTEESSSRWAGAITKAPTTSGDWSAVPNSPTSRTWRPGGRTIRHRLSLQAGAKGCQRSPGGYRTRQEWFAKTRRLRLLRDRLAAERADWETGRVRVVRGGNRLLHTRIWPPQARPPEHWRAEWEASRRFLQADGESGKKFGNETIRVTPDGGASIKLPARARPGGRRREGTRPARPGPRTRCAPPTAGAHAGDQDIQDRSGCSADQV
ncbi:hypothetical protein [Nocardiopsis sp. FIRDI 009]|uniref:hypothetical protein n=1 Tax=Nocardiopsis sp. FIRDI 009 TaxID=714197 RepID=UPI0018E4ECA1|nr:hypothetical protein [Nocardiopsis sp. FIRDI 009]